MRNFPQFSLFEFETTLGIMCETFHNLVFLSLLLLWELCVKLSIILFLMMPIRFNRKGAGQLPKRSPMKRWRSGTPASLQRCSTADAMFHLAGVSGASDMPSPPPGSPPPSCPHLGSQPGGAPSAESAVAEAERNAAWLQDASRARSAAIAVLRDALSQHTSQPTLSDSQPRSQVDVTPSAPQQGFPDASTGAPPTAARPVQLRRHGDGRGGYGADAAADPASAPRAGHPRACPVPRPVVALRLR